MGWWRPARSRVVDRLAGHGSPGAAAGWRSAGAARAAAQGRRHRLAPRPHWATAHRARRASAPSTSRRRAEIRRRSKSSDSRRRRPTRHLLWPRREVRVLRRKWRRRLRLCPQSGAAWKRWCRGARLPPGTSGRRSRCSGMSPRSAGPRCRASGAVPVSMSWRRRPASAAARSGSGSGAAIVADQVVDGYTMILADCGRISWRSPAWSSVALKLCCGPHFWRPSPQAVTVPVCRSMVMVTPRGGLCSASSRAISWAMASAIGWRSSVVTDRIYSNKFATAMEGLLLHRFG